MKIKPHDFKIANVTVTDVLQKATDGSQAIVVPYTTDKDGSIQIDVSVPKDLHGLLEKENVAVVFDNIYYSFVYAKGVHKEQEDKIAKAVKAIPAKYKNILVCYTQTNASFDNLVSAVVLETANKWSAKNVSKGEEKSARNLTFVMSFDNTTKEQADEIVQKAVTAAAIQLEVIRLVDMPSNYLTPTQFAKEAEDFVKAQASEKVKFTEIVGENLQTAQYGSMYAVSKGSVEAAHLVTLEYFGGAEGEAPIVFVGKGLTFDSGGISLKPSKGMGAMKGDMAGAATAFGLFQYAVKAGLKKNVVAILACAENMPDGGSVKPGDVITAYNGKTIEVEDTDAEGRLVLADALCHAQKFKGQYTIDFATLTGACIVALGHVHTGLFTESDELAELLLNAGKETGDTAWQLPMGDEYKHFLDSKVADLNNLCLGQGGGATNGAIFLKEFAPETGWCHLDIAGTSEVKSATGRPLPMMIKFLENL